MVAYRWHAWFGLAVRIHDVIGRGAGTFARCSLQGVVPDRVQELPLWMLDTATCGLMRNAARPVAAATALAELRALLLTS